jgi:hypothetical protein
LYAVPEGWSADERGALMLRVIIGEVIGAIHQTRKNWHGALTVEHLYRRRIETPVPGFHFPGVGTYHFMRREVVEHPDSDTSLRFRWHSYCGLHWLFLSADGTCTEMSPNDGPAQYCNPCVTCERRAQEDTYVSAMLARKGER